jgi:hypothetical protein
MAIGQNDGFRVVRRGCPDAAPGLKRTLTIDWALAGRSYGRDIAMAIHNIAGRDKRTANSDQR